MSWRRPSSARDAPDTFDYTYPDSPVDTMVRHPYDDKVVLGAVGVLRNLPEDVSAMGADEVIRDVCAVLPGTNPNKAFEPHSSASCRTSGHHANA